MLFINEFYRNRVVLRILIQLWDEFEENCSWYEVADSSKGQMRMDYIFDCVNVENLEFDDDLYKKNKNRN